MRKEKKERKYGKEEIGTKIRTDEVEGETDILKDIERREYSSPDYLCTGKRRLSGLRGKQR
jgi:hypothetical protein